MTKRTEIGGDVNKTTGGDHIVYSLDYIRNNSRDYFAQNGFEGGISFNNPEKPQFVNTYFVKGYWSIDEKGNKEIKKTITK